MKILLYSSQKSNRLEYIVQVIFSQILSVECLITNDLDYFIQYQLPKIFYGVTDLNILNIPASSFIFEQTLNQNLDFQPKNKGEDLTLFSQNNSGLGFDIFSASFYIVSRYEEYLPHKKDNFERFIGKNSTLTKFEAIEFPMLHIWALKLGNYIQTHYPHFEFKLPNFHFIPSIDIDIAFAYKGRNVKRQVLALGKQALKFNIIGLKDRVLTLLQLKKDPYDTYSIIENLATVHHKKWKLFLQCGHYQNQTDKSIIQKNSFYQHLIQDWKKWADVGLHPSVKASNEFDFLKSELETYKIVAQNECFNSRQHYLSIYFPDTYNNLIKLGIKNDFSMGYADVVGFRAGIAIPYPHFDLITNEVTSLTIHPFQIMDGTLQQYLQLNPTEAMEKFRQLANVCKKYGGNFTILWHNQSFSDTENWKGWKNTFITMFEEAIKYEE